MMRLPTIEYKNRSCSLFVEIMNRTDIIIHKKRTEMMCHQKPLMEQRFVFTPVVAEKVVSIVAGSLTSKHFQMMLSRSSAPSSIYYRTLIVESSPTVELTVESSSSLSTTIDPIDRWIASIPLEGSNNTEMNSTDLPRTIDRDGMHSKVEMENESLFPDPGCIVVSNLLSPIYTDGLPSIHTSGNTTTNNYRLFRHVAFWC
jgi:hypothetical protein